MSGFQQDNKMAGLLDTGMMKLLFGGAQHMKDRESARQGQQYQSMLDRARTPSATAYGSMMQPQTETYNSRTGATEITGGEQMQGAGTQVGGMMDPQTRRQFNANIGQIPQYRDMSTNLQMQDARGDQAMQRQQQEQAFYNNNVTAYQQMMADQAQQNSNRTYNAGQDQQNFQQAITVGANFDKEVAPYDDAIRGAQSMDQLFPDDNYTINGSAQLAGVMRFMKQANDGGAFMSDDMQNSARANGFMGGLSDMFAWATTSGFKNEGFMRDMHEIMAKQATMDSQNIERQRQTTRQAYGNRFSEQGYDAIFSRSALGSRGTYVPPAHLAKPRPDKNKKRFTLIEE